MKGFLRIAAVVLMAAAVGCAPRERTLVLLSTNDMHAKIQNFPRLASAVEACRDTTQLVVLVDAGDRWTGNAYVDMAPTPGIPIISLMNELGYEVATLGNHEFDHGQAFLGRMIDSMDFTVVCANVVSDTVTFPKLPPYTILKKNGFKIGFIGVVTNYEGPGYPAGNASSFVGLEFPDPQEMALKYAAELRPKCDILVLVSHMGDDRDAELLGKAGGQFDVVIGGHTHKMIDTLIGGTLLTQTGKDLKNIGVTTIRMRGKKVENVGYRIVPLTEYEPDPLYMEQVEKYYANPELNRPIGQFDVTANKWGLADWMAESVADEGDADVGFYHIGGVRLDSIPAGGVGKAHVYGLEPFGTLVATLEMTPEEMREMIIAKYNDTINVKEAHRIDLISTTPYTINTTEDDKAWNVEFPKLKEEKRYKVAMSDYIFRNYKDLNYKNGEITDKPVTEILLEELEEESPIEIDNTPKQQVKEGVYRRMSAVDLEQTNARGLYEICQ